ncbi:MAG: hypothetical protein HFI51_12400 [Lachnospiraceae bacterium]|jgi:hypothetical protein|nr:hypothetical protein [Lachnospiraceae bacterium]
MTIQLWGVVGVRIVCYAVGIKGIAPVPGAGRHKRELNENRMKQVKVSDQHTAESLAHFSINNWDKEIVIITKFLNLINQ